jgi:hypothetical protein
MAGDISARRLPVRSVRAAESSSSAVAGPVIEFHGLVEEGLVADGDDRGQFLM